MIDERAFLTKKQGALILTECIFQVQLRTDLSHCAVRLLQLNYSVHARHTIAYTDYHRVRSNQVCWPHRLPKRHTPSSTQPTPTPEHSRPSRHRNRLYSAQHLSTEQLSCRVQVSRHLVPICSDVRVSHGHSAHSFTLLHVKWACVHCQIIFRPRCHQYPTLQFEPRKQLLQFAAAIVRWKRRKRHRAVGHHKRWNRPVGKWCRAE